MLQLMLLLTSPPAEVMVYTDELAVGWSTDASWNTKSLDLDDNYSGEIALHAWLDDGGGLWLAGPDFSGATTLSFTMLADSTDLTIHVVDDDGNDFGSQLLSDYGNTFAWSYTGFEIPLTDIHPGTWTGIQFRSQTKGGDEFWIDDIKLLSGTETGTDTGVPTPEDDTAAPSDSGLPPDTGDTAVSSDTGATDTEATDSGTVDTAADHDTSVDDCYIPDTGITITSDTGCGCAQQAPTSRGTLLTTLAGLLLVAIRRRHFR